jgi:myo-inositol 2-dehydrogenase/D-chiro-inositol 1-dehydrogenase
MGLRIAVIGCGYIATACHGPACVRYAATHRGVELAACCDVDGERAEQFRHEFGFGRAYASYLEMLRVERPDAVCLCVPERLAAEMGGRILELGVPLLAEKPPAMTVAEMDRLIALAEATGTLHQVALNRRFAPLLVHLQALLEGRKVQHVDHTFTRVGRRQGDFSTTAIHAVDTLRYLLGCDYERVRFAYHEHPTLGTGVADTIMDCTFTGGATGHLTICPVAGADAERVAVYAAGHAYQASLNWGADAPGRLRHWHEGQLAADVDAVQQSGRAEEYVISGYYGEDEAFFDAVQAGRQPVHDLASARQSVEIMACLRERRKEYIRT